MRIIYILLLVSLLSGCTSLETLIDLYPDPDEPVCDIDSVGVQWKGYICLKYDDGGCRWKKIQ